MNYSRNAKVIVSPMDWGLGHASRLSVVVATLVSRGCCVTLAGSGRSLDLLSADFPQLPVVSLPSFSPRIVAGRWLWLRIGLMVPTFLWGIIRERWQTERLVRRLRTDLIISDNRYGVRSRRARSLFITHQFHPHVAPGAPGWVEGLVSRVLNLFVRGFDACLVPDVAIGGLSGNLSSPVPVGVVAHKVGLLSRLALAEADGCGRVDWLGVASGPEPQRSEFVDYLIARFDALEGRRVVVCADAQRRDFVSRGGVEVIGLANASLLKGLMINAAHIVCRAGYSTIMDLAAIGRLNGDVELIPTPGQAEQVYLAQTVLSCKCAIK